ncbi:MAG: putative Aminodeoxychorismate lyase [Candidatus Saccharibacteria bacterium]|nr:putative Aminodeoxychorismate lyase [Candidatus Saccharibacteria bacterium]
MPPERSRQRPVDGVHHRPTIKPDYRPDHELKAPPRQVLIKEHEPEVIAEVVAEVKAVVPEQEPTASAQEPATQTLDDIHDEEPMQIKSKKRWLIPLIAVIVVVIVAIISAYAWYQGQLAPVSTDTTKHVRVTIKVGSTPSAIADQLQTDGVIKNKLAFTIYTKLTHTENNLKAGTYSLQPSVSTPAIVDHLVAGKQDTFSMTFLPGDTLDNNRQKLITAGYTSDDVDAALKKTYDSPLFATKPLANDLEGYFYGQTNEFDTSATPSSILETFFGEYNDFLTQNNIAAGLQKQGLSLYQGITLASIVQREVGTKDMPQVARVFLNRLKAGMTLGSDVTYQYAAKKLGVAPDPSLDSPYNTRKYPGLPPGPIATPGNTALLAVANPADNNYLFFLSGDDDVTYYATTDAQHQQNILQHCQKKCSVN